MSNIQEYTILFLIWLISTILVRAFFKKRSLPPGPRALPIIGHLHLLAPIPHQALARLASRYGPLIHIHLGSVPCIVASSPDISKEILKTNESAFLDRPQTVATDYLTYGSKDFSFAPYGPYWKFVKKLCMSELLNGRMLDQLQPIRRDEVKQLVHFLAGKESVDVGCELVRMANNVISRMIMSERCSGDEDEAGVVRKLVHETAELTGKFNPSDYIWLCKNLDVMGLGKRMKEVRDRFDEMMRRIIDEHRIERNGLEKKKKKKDVKDLLDILLDIAEDESSEIKLSEENIKAFFLDLFAAGTDTSAITVEWALAELINHPKILQNGVEEIDAVVGKNRLVEESDIPNLPYLQAIVKETLRLHPAGPLILRECNKDCTVAGYRIRAKTRLFVNVWAIGRDPAHWERPLEFNPERFVSTNGQVVDVRGQHYHYLPFGTGSRGCPGATLALQVVQTTLGALIQCFDWQVEGGGRVDMEEGPGLTLPRAHPLVCCPVARVNPIPLM